MKQDKKRGGKKRKTNNRGNTHHGLKRTGTVNV